MKAILCLCVLGLGACTTTDLMQDAEPTAPPGPDEAKVIVYRTDSFGGKDHYPVFEVAKGEGHLLGLTETDCYFEIRCRPGRHVFVATGEGRVFVDADLEGGQTYFIRAYSRFGLLSSRPGFEPVERGSKEWPKVQEILLLARCRELNPATSDDFRRSEQAELQADLPHWAEDRSAAKLLRPDDGQADLSLPAR